MAKIEWDNSLSVGIDLIDEQHKMLYNGLTIYPRLLKASEVRLR